MHDDGVRSPMKRPERANADEETSAQIVTSIESLPATKASSFSLTRPMLPFSMSLASTPPTLRSSAVLNRLTVLADFWIPTQKYENAEPLSRQSDAIWVNIVPEDAVGRGGLKSRDVWWVRLVVGPLLPRRSRKGASWWNDGVLWKP